MESMSIGHGNTANNFREHFVVYAIAENHVNYSQSYFSISYLLQNIQEEKNEETYW
jgi:hypothetical protein